MRISLQKYLKCVEKGVVDLFVRFVKKKTIFESFSVSQNLFKVSWADYKSFEL
jgi:hypothetical protein